MRWSRPPVAEPAVVEPPRRGRFWTFAFGFVVGALALFGLALLATLAEFLTPATTAAPAAIAR